MASAYIQNSDRYFKNPDKFNPKRWIKSDKEYEPIHPYSNLPFGFGARQCIGRALAEQEILLVTSNV